MVTVETCNYCKGRGVAETVQEHLRGEWVNAREAYARDARPDICAMVAFDAARGGHPAFRIIDCACPRCNGRGKYETEHFRGVAMF